jgi:hypothetical protein
LQKRRRGRKKNKKICGKREEKDRRGSKQKNELFFA